MKLTMATLMQLLLVFLWSYTAKTQVEATVGLYGPDRYEGLPEICLMPMDFGYCRAKVQRYYFDIRRMKCTMFFWGGCAGNDNNFKSIEECNNFCTSAYEDQLHNELVVVKKEPNVRESSRGSTKNINTISSRDSSSSSSSSIPKTSPKFALKANVSSKETGYKSQFKASFNIYPQQMLRATVTVIATATVITAIHWIQLKTKTMMTNKTGRVLF
ncbi:hypothetical protein DOY81_005475 [Sarcophaga bullata]|nr:hypothetical protein DOY81_005475 [Sarcophaga bullata]